MIAVSVSIAGFSIMRGGRDANSTTTRVQSDISGRTEATAMSGRAAGRLGAVVEPQKPPKQVGNADTSQVPKSLRPVEPISIEFPVHCKSLHSKFEAWIPRLSRGRGLTGRMPAKWMQFNNR